MAKRKKTPKTSVITARTTEAPMLVTRSADEAPVATVVEVPEGKLAIEPSNIARLAFAKFAARGYTHGHAVEDWLAAEAELRAAHAN